jgi:hypothetical protein
MKFSLARRNNDCGAGWFCIAATWIGCGNGLFGTVLHSRYAAISNSTSGLGLPHAPPLRVLMLHWNPDQFKA